MVARRLVHREELFDHRSRAADCQINQKWVTIRDTYNLEVADGVDPGLALAVLWSVDRWVEKD